MITKDQINAVESVMSIVLEQLGWEKHFKTTGEVFWLKKGEGACSTDYAYEIERNKFLESKFKKEG